MIKKLKKIIKHLNKAQKIAKEIAEEYNCYEDKDGRCFYVKTKEYLYKIAELIGEKVIVDDTGWCHTIYNLKYKDEIEFIFGEFQPLNDEVIEKAKQKIRDMFSNFEIFDKNGDNNDNT